MSGTNPEQFILWPERDTPTHERTVPIRWADGDTSVEAVQRLLGIVKAERNHRLVGYTFVRGGYISFYMKIRELWVENGIIYARGPLTAEGAIAQAMMAGREVKEETDEED